MSSLHVPRPSCFLTPAVFVAASFLSVARASAPILPAPGQTVNWTIGMSPVTFDGSATIPAGGTVLVDPGVILQFNNLSRLFVSGRLQANGTAAQPVVIDGQPSGWLVARGEVVLSHCTIDNTIAQGTNSRLEVRNSAFTSGAFLLTDMVLGPMRAVVEDTTVSMPNFRLVGEVLLRDVTVQGGGAELLGYVRTEGLVSQGAPVTIYREHQRALVEHVSVSGVNGPGLVLDGNHDFLIDSTVTTSGNVWPIHLAGAGLAPGSHVPATGNVNNAILGFSSGAIDGELTLPNLGLPYVILAQSDFTGRVTVEPGVEFRMGSAGRFFMLGDFFHRGGNLVGDPDDPIVFSRHVAHQPWVSLGGSSGNFRLQNVVIDGATQGIAAPGSQVLLTDCVVQNCGTGIQPSGQGDIEAIGTRFLANGIGARGDTTILSNGLHLDGFARPNVFAGNGVGVQKGNSSGTPILARGNWWNHASGPTSPFTNPAGQGDSISFGVDGSQYLTAEPTLADTPPTVRLEEKFFLADPGEVLYLRWKSNDDVAIVAHEVWIDLKGGGDFAFQPIATGISGAARDFAFVMPDPGFNVFARPALVRVLATDTAGQTSYDEIVLHVSSADYAGVATVTNDLMGGFEPLERFPVCWSASGVASGSLRAHLVLDTDSRILVGPAGNSGNTCSFSDLVIPYVSTDSARIALFADGQGNDDEWFFSEPFSIRPDAMFGDQPPSITMISPSNGQSFAGGDTIGVTWSASDDEAVRAVKVQVSFNGGRTWQAASEELPGAATGFSWKAPFGIDVADLRIRVIAIDRHFQDSSDGATRSFSISSVSAWSNLGGGLAGIAGIPALAGSGPLTSGSPTSLTLQSGAPNSGAYLIVGASMLGVPFKGGVLVPAPNVVIGPLPLSPAGGFALSAPWVSGVPSGVSLWWQAWIVDAAGPQGMAASNAVRSTTP